MRVVEALNVASTLVDGMCFSALHREFQATWLGYTLGAMVEILLILLSYVLGSVPTGILAGCAFGVDVRMVGSGNIGTANVLRAAGWCLANATLMPHPWRQSFASH